MQIKHRSERTYEVGDMVYLKMQPYRLVVFGLRQSLKLTNKFYGPFRILQKVGAVAYRLRLPAGVGIHLVFHISQLKKHLGPWAIPVPWLLLVDKEGMIKTKPTAVLDTRALPRPPQLVMQRLVQWMNLSPEESIWEDADFIKGSFPEFYVETIRSWFPANESWDKILVREEYCHDCSSSSFQAEANQREDKRGNEDLTSQMLAYRFTHSEHSRSLCSQAVGITVLTFHRLLSLLHSELHRILLWNSSCIKRNGCWNGKGNQHYVNYPSLRFRVR